MQVVGIFALVASLIFVGLQMRQTQEIALSAAYQARAATAIELGSSLTSNETAMVALFRTQNGEEFEPLDLQERLVADLYAANYMLLYENVHRRYEMGFISEEDWLRVYTNLRKTMRNPITRNGSMQRLDTMRPSFREVAIEIDNERRD